jgi:hypothetical protein
MEIFHESDISAILQMLPSFGTKYAPLVMGYCYLFGVTPFRLKAKKLRLLLEELRRLFDAESFSFEKRKYGISHAGIAEALDIMIKRNFSRTLPNHNYLKQIMIGISEREGKADGRTAEKDLRKKEAGLMSGNRDARPYPVPEERVDLPPMKTVPADNLTDEQFAENRRRALALVKSITKAKEA